MSTQGFFSISTVEDALLVVKDEPGMVVSLPEGLLTTEVLFTALTHSDAVFDMLDPVFYSSELINQLLVYNAGYFKHIPRRLIKEQHLLNMVKHNGLSLEFIPTELLNEKICLMAIDQDVSSHEFVPDKLQGVNYLNRLIENNPNYVALVDVGRRDVKTLRKLVEEHPDMIKFMTMPDRCINVCQAALKDSIHNIQHFPERIYNKPAMIKQMASHDYFKQTDTFAANLIRPELAKYLINNYPECYTNLPLSSKTTELAKIAIKYNPLNILDTPASLKRDGLLWEYTLGLDSSLYHLIPLAEQSDNVRLFIAQQKAIKRNANQSNVKSYDEVVLDDNALLDDVVVLDTGNTAESNHV